MGLRAAALAVALLLGLPTLAGCGGDADGEPASGRGTEPTQGHETDQEAGNELEGAADRTICQADATAVATPYAEGFPDAWRFPPRTTVYDVEDRGSTGVIVTGISSTPFKQILDFLNHDAVDAGFEVTGGETEEHDAEANWSTGRQDGRWAIRESPQCPGETVIQVYAEPTS
ncbi:hypothetical protein [Nocardioides panaciterrulae]|uniref:Secreted protein n=1 Tax=Nocardioides panaciterrulae TaxID=661492 RepID=A0A7Y9E2Y2_9ACTN|nr:hypothetical protein [Nocardioides panaciterrulae]NYD40047.1 hypothetical protein [Nocardioides panaciterrulae]